MTSIHAKRSGKGCAHAGMKYAQPHPDYLIGVEEFQKFVKARGIPYPMAAHHALRWWIRTVGKRLR